MKYLILLITFDHYRFSEVVGMCDSIEGAHDFCARKMNHPFYCYGGEWGFSQPSNLEGETHYQIMNINSKSDFTNAS